MAFLLYAVPLLLFSLELPPCSVSRQNLEVWRIAGLLGFPGALRLPQKHKSLIEYGGYHGAVPPYSRSSCPLPVPIRPTSIRPIKNRVKLDYQS